MIADFDIDILKKDLHKNLILIEKQISNYSNKFKIRLSNYIKDKNELSFLNKITYKIQNDISDNLCNLLFYIGQTLDNNKEVLIISNKIINYVDKNKFILSKDTIDNIENNIFLNINKANTDEINIIKKIFISYKKSLNFAINSLNKKVYELVNSKLNDFSLLNTLMIKDDNLLLILSYFNISYDKRKNNLYIKDSEKIISLIKNSKNSYKINDKINLLIKYNKDKFYVALEINNKIVKTIILDAKNKVITFLYNKKHNHMICYEFNSDRLYISKDNNLRSTKLNNLSYDIKEEIKKIDESLIAFIKLFPKL